MAGLLDLFNQDPTQAYGDALDPQQRQAIAQQGLLSLTERLARPGSRRACRSILAHLWRKRSGPPLRA